MSRVSILRLQGVLVVVLLLTGALLATPSPVRAASAAPASVVAAGAPAPSTAEDLDTDGGPDYWTPERMEDATPLDLDEAGEPIDGVGKGSSSLRARAAARVIPRSTGKLFFRTPQGDSVCSAATVNTARKNLIITAGHCINSGATRGLLGQVTPGTTYSNFRFVPRYNHGNEPFGGWVGTRAILHNQWVNQVDAYHYDHGLIEVAPRNGRQLVQVVGGNAVAWNYPARQDDVQVWGWPAEQPYDGTTGLRCTGKTQAIGGGDAAVACPMTGGASGGPWFIGMINDHVGYIWAVTSRRTLTGTKRLLAVPFTNSLKVLLSASQNGRPVAGPTPAAGAAGPTRTAVRPSLTLQAGRQQIGRGQLVRMTARTPARARIAVDVRLSKRGKWTRVAVRNADAAGIVKMSYRMSRAGDRWYRIRSGKRVSAQVRIVVHACPLPYDRTKAVVAATKCSTPIN